MTRIGRYARLRPATLAITGLIAVVGIAAIATGSRGPFTLETLGLDTAGIRDRHWWLFATSLISAGGVVQLVVAVLVAFFGLGVAERLMGSSRTVLAFLVTGLLASVFGVGFELLGQTFGEFWSRSVNELDTVDPITPIAGALGWASAWAPPLWRRRLRVGILAVAASLLLYSGQPTDLYLLIAAVLGILIGSRLRPSPPSPRSAHETRAMLALVTVVFAVGPVLTLVSATRYGVLSPLGVAVMGGAPPGAAMCHPAGIATACIDAFTRRRLSTPDGLLVSVLPLVLTLIGARGILGGRRNALILVAVLAALDGIAAAWYLGVAPLSAVPSAIAPASSHEWEFTIWLVVSTVIPLAFGAVLLAFRRSFPVRSTRRRTGIAALVVSGGLVIPIAAYLGIGLASPTAFRPPATGVVLLRYALQRLTPAPLLRHSLPVLMSHELAPKIAGQLLGPVFWLAMIAAALVLIGGRRAVENSSTGQLRQLLRAGSGTLGHLATWPGVRLWTSSSGRTGVPFKLVDGSAITVSDPIGQGDDPDATIDGFLAYCDQQAWTPVFYSIHEEWTRRLEARGWTSLEVAEETVIDPTAFELTGRAMQDVRTSVNRAGRLGLHTAWSTWDGIGLRRAAQIDALSETWVSGRELPELGFTLGGADELRDPEVLIGMVFDPDDRLLAVTSWLPVTADGELIGRTLDVMRRRGDAPNGVMEYLIADGLTRMGEEGIRQVSLSGSPLARLDAADPSASESGALDGSLRVLGRMLEPAYGFRSLLRFKSKFQPEFRPLALAVRDPLSLPAVGLAIARAYLPTLSLRDVRRLLSAGR